MILKPAPLRLLAQALICRLIPREIAIGGINLVLNQKDAIVSGNLALGCYETFNLEVFDELLGPGMCVLDVGANIGLYSAIAAARVGHLGRVVAVEPDSVNCSFLSKTKERNRLDNLTIVQKAAGSETATVRLHLCATNKADHRTYGGDSSRSSVAVEMTSLDALAADLNLPAIDVLKIDTQGYEFFIAHGMQTLLEQSPRVRIMMEFWPWGIERAGGSPSRLLEFFGDRGFKVAVLNDKKKRLEWLDSFESILGLKLERQHVDLFLTRDPSSIPVSISLA